MSSPQIPESMHAMRYAATTNGLESNLRSDNSTPLPPTAKNLKPDQALVQVLSMSINPADYKVPEMFGRFLIKKPASPGMDYAGRVTSLGKDLQARFRPGQLVFGRLGDGLPDQYGTLGSYIIAKREGIAAIPDSVSVDDAASVGTAALTAYQSIVPHIRRGDNVFIHGGSGGTGVWGIQIAKAMDCYVATTCSGANADLCRGLGADTVIDYRTQDVLTELKGMGRQFDLVVDNVGNMAELYWKCQSFTRPGAKFIQVGAEPSLAATWVLLSRLLWPSFLGGGQRPFQFMTVKNKYDDFVQIGEWMKEGKVKAVTEQVFAYEDTVQAFKKLKSHRVKGKLVIRVNEQGRE